MEDTIHSSTSTPAASRVIERPSAQDRQEALRCPRCDSPNTKFCYYNNYSLSQPRHFCRACKRYWTRGGTLRNVPIGGGCRKNNRVKRAATVMVAPSRIIPSMSMQSSPLHLDSSSMVYSLPQTAARLSHETLALQGLPNCNHVSSCSTSIFDDLQSAQFSVHDVHHLPQLHQYSPLSSEVLPSMDVYLLLGSLSSAAAASHLVSSLKQPKKADGYEGLFPCEELQDCGEDMNILSMMKEVEAERLGNATNNYSYNNKNDMVESQILCDNSSKRFSATTATNLPNDSSVLHPAEVEAAAAAACPDAANYRSCII